MLHVLPCGVTVERMLSCAGQILVPRRCKSNDMFEKVVFAVHTKVVCFGTDMFDDVSF